MTKNNFLKTEYAKRFAAIAASIEFEAACDTALLHFILSPGDVSDHNQAIARAYQLDGAKRFLRILQQIATPEQVKAEAGLGYKEMVKT